jgi:sirohydrochlorin ferrochelatase
MTRLLIVAHGQPSDPGPAAQELADLARRVGDQMPDWDVSAATLAEPGALEAAASTGPGLVFPLFMAGGWFTRVQIPNRLAQAGGQGWQILEPFGCDPAVHQLARSLAQEAGGGDVILAAHGSFKSPVPAAIARAVAGLIAQDRPSARVETGFIDQAPQISGIRGMGADAICLPFFAMAGGHVTDDIPAALAEAGFQGRILPPVGSDYRVPGLIAAAARAGRRVCAEACRYAPGA